LSIALGVVVGAGPALANPALAAPSHRDLSAWMTGRQEVPAAGDPDGWGATNVRIWPRSGRICYTLFVRRIASAITAAHIHEGRRGIAGPVVVPLETPTSGWARDCAEIDRDLARRIARHPSRFYVNVHNEGFPAGAVRGQLFRQG
jgi:hypothetical protein